MTPTQALQKFWGYPTFRPGQSEIVEAVMEAKDTLALLPTGGGKSICYQLPAVVLPGVTIVVSPLIALMKDQVRQLKSRGIVAEAIHSGLRLRDIDRILDNAVYGQTKLLYLSPERLRTDLAQARIARMNVSLLAVDEAHCISQWGYDFRPSYLTIGDLREMLPGTPCIAVTATATPEVVIDIQEQLQFGKNKLVYQQSFGRDNLSYVVRRPDNKEEEMLKVLRGAPGSSIVYVRSRGMTRRLAVFLRRAGIAAAAYHAGLEPKQKDERQEAWLKGDLRVIVATNAFGMGIDKPNVRTVIHYGPPDSPEAYFQEAGRGGRDGHMSYAVLLYHESDGQRLRQYWRDSYPPLTEIRRIYRALGSFLQLATGSGEGVAYDFDIIAFCNRFNFEVRPGLAGLKALERAGYLVLTEATHQPARLRFKVSKERLYDYQLKHRNSAKLIKAILRTSHGAFLEAVRIDEGSLANFLNITVEQLQQTFRRMEQGEIIEYLPPTNDPQLIFLRDRVVPEHLHIDQKAYKFLKDRQEVRIETMIAYCEKDLACRSALLLQYFGELDVKPCGICDICRSQLTNSSQITPRRLYQLMQQKLSDQGQMEVEEAVTAYGNLHRSSTESALQELLNEGLIIRAGAFLRKP